jgi:hypothetical protein
MFLLVITFSFSNTCEYSMSETGANKKAGQVRAERSPVKEASDFIKDWKAPFCSVGILSTLLTSSWFVLDIKKKV